MYTAEKRNLRARYTAVNAATQVMRRENYENISRYFRKYHTLYISKCNNIVIAVRNGNNEGSGPDFKYTDFVERWEKANGSWDLISKEETYSSPQLGHSPSLLDDQELSIKFMGELFYNFANMNNITVY